MWLPTKQVQMWAVLTDVTAEQRRNSPSVLLRTNLDYEDQFGVSQCTEGKFACAEEGKMVRVWGKVWSEQSGMAGGA